MKTRRFFPLSFLLALGMVLASCSPPAGGLSGASSPEGETSSSDATSSAPVSEDRTLWNTDDADISHIRSERLIAFTFDDGPKEETEALLDVFADFNRKNPDMQAHATLFMLGGNITPADVPLLKEAHENGFEMGNHSFTHTNFQTISDEQILEELAKTDALLQEIDGKEKHLIRPPGGHYDERVLSLGDAPFVNWTQALDTSDWSDPGENDIYNKVLSNLADGGIVLMHQGYADTVNAVKRLLPDLKQRGFQVVSVSELAKAYGLELHSGNCYSYLG